MQVQLSHRISFNIRLMRSNTCNQDSPSKVRLQTNLQKVNIYDRTTQTWDLSQQFKSFIRNKLSPKIMVHKRKFSSIFYQSEYMNKLYQRASKTKQRQRILCSYSSMLPIRIWQFNQPSLLFIHNWQHLSVIHIKISKTPLKSNFII